MLLLCEQKPYKAITAQDTPREASRDGEDVPGNSAKKRKVEEERVHQDMRMFVCTTKFNCP